MSLRDGPLSDMKPSAGWLAGAAVAIALLLGLGLFVSGGRALEPARRIADSLEGPEAKVLAAPVAVAGDGLDGLRGYFLAGSQNAELRRQLTLAQNWRDRAAALADENLRLKALLGIRTEPPLPMVSAHTILDARGPFANSRLADAGSDLGVTEGNPVMSDHGLIGRVVGVSARVSRIMLLTDVQSRTPVLILRTNGRAILTGDGGPNPTLAYLRTHDPVRQGDRVLTSGDGGVIPRGLPVGAAVRGSDGGWRVTLDAEAAPIDLVRILLFRDFAQLASPGALAPSALPGPATQAPDIPAAATNSTGQAPP